MDDNGAQIQINRMDRQKSAWIENEADCVKHLHKVWQTFRILNSIRAWNGEWRAVFCKTDLIDEFLCTAFIIIKTNCETREQQNHRQVIDELV